MRHAYGHSDADCDIHSHANSDGNLTLTVTFKLGPNEGLEYKYRMEKGASMVYAWTSTGRVKFDFHGEPQGAIANALPECLGAEAGENLRLALRGTVRLPRRATAAQDCCAPS